MTRIRFAIIACGSAISGCSGVQVEPAIQAEDVLWNSARPLSWDDFLGPVDPRATGDRVAMTAATLSWGYEYQIERDDESCAYWLTDIHAEAIFNQRESWVRPGYRNASVLGHEQGHFDLTQIYKLILDDGADELIGRRNPCEGGSIQEASRFADESAAELAHVLFDDVWQQYLATQERYDAETQHGTVSDAQSRWTESIQRRLRSGQWRP